ncbi:uncharacterized protein LOC132538303 [Erinaceus europaeus]|uniref:Uncharacterized protein LOC132538303 n=1 Tax=Erinaceus europaeus TaxID=9365 RepID=A0ABM3XDK5_ERIEU|nr:uncharacterized protein LOC132538303 [Erinaceus europaeus]
MESETQIWGMVPTVLKMSKDPTNFYVGRALWFSITFIYFSVVYVVQTTWGNLAGDFHCHGPISQACTAECYESHFCRPIVGVWYVIGFIFSSIFFVTEFFVSRTVHKKINQCWKRPVEELKESTEEPTQIKEDEIFDLSQEKSLLAMYLIYFLLQLSVQVTFLVILIHYQLPLVKKPIRCSTPMCYGPYPCVVMGTQEKMMSIILLATLSVVIMTFCIMFFLYTINVYLVTVRKSVDSSTGSHY